MTDTDLLAPPAASQQLEDQLCLDLYVAARAITGAYRAQLAPYGLTYPQYLVMLALWQHGSQSVKRLGERLVLDAGTLSPMLKRLEATGYVNRQRQAEDARELRVSLTDSGIALKHEIADIRERVMCATGLTAATTLNLQTTLRDLTTRLKACAPEE